MHFGILLLNNPTLLLCLLVVIFFSLKRRHILKISVPKAINVIIIFDIALIAVQSQLHKHIFIILTIKESDYFIRKLSKTIWYKKLICFLRNKLDLMIFW